MKWLLVSLAPVPVVAAFVLGWFNPGTPAEIVSAERAGARAAGRAPRDSAERTAAVEELAAYVAGDHFAGPVGDAGGEPVIQPFDESAPLPIAAAPPPEPPPPPPPPPDVGVVFRRQVSAVVLEPNGRLAVVMVDRSGESGSRRLRVGDRFEGSWTLISLTRDAAVLSDGGRMRRVPFFGGPVTEEGASRG